MAFVVHSESRPDARDLRPGGEIVCQGDPQYQGSYAKEMGIKGSWLVFEKSE